jgi:acetyl esterase
MLSSIFKHFALAIVVILCSRLLQHPDIFKGIIKAGQSNEYTSPKDLLLGIVLGLQQNIEGLFGVYIENILPGIDQFEQNIIYQRAKVEFLTEQSSFVLESQHSRDCRMGKTCKETKYVTNDNVTLIKISNGVVREKIIVIWFHGGGMVFGSAQDYMIAYELASRGWLVLSVEYALAPEYPYPKGVMDGVSAVEWVKMNIGNDKLHGVNRFILSGISAGGLMTTAVTHKLLLMERSNNKQQPWLPILTVPISPTYTPLPLQSYLENWETHLLPARRMTWYWNMYMGKNNLDGLVSCVSDPICSPLAPMNLHGMPPTLIFYGTKDVLTTETQIYIDLLKKHACDVKVIILSGSHGVSVLLIDTVVQEFEDTVNLVKDGKVIGK